ncbi:MAG: UDP-glucuronic acid decarboxylase family protein [Candidatus Anstonellales archaeon]
MRVVITGGAGFIGSYLCERFLNEGAEVVCIDNLITGSMENIGHLESNRRFEFVKMDVSKEPIREKCTHVLHFASPASPVDYQRYALETLMANSIGTKNAIECALRNKAFFLFASTSEVYGDPLVHPQPESYWGNVNPIGPRSMYDESKRFGEALVMHYVRKGAMANIVRIFNTYGPRMRLNDGRIVPNFMVQAIKGKPLTVYGNGKQTRSFCFIDDLVEGIWRYSTSGLKGEVINMGNPEEHTVLQFAKFIKKATRSSSEIVMKPLPQDDPRQRRPDIAKAKRLLKWEPKVPLAEGLRRTAEWFKEELEA